MRDGSLEREWAAVRRDFGLKVCECVNGCVNDFKGAAKTWYL